MKSDISDTHGMEICIGNLSLKEYDEVQFLLQSGDYFLSKYYESFSDFSEYYHANGVFVYDDLYSLIDLENNSEGDFEFLEDDESEFKNVNIPSKGIYLCTFRNESLIFCGRGVYPSKVKLKAVVDEFRTIKQISKVGVRILVNVLNEGMPLDRNSLEEEATGEIFDTIQMVIKDNRLVNIMSSSTEGDLQFPFNEVKSNVNIYFNHV